jgi:hypothetical protein
MTIIISIIISAILAFAAYQIAVTFKDRANYRRWIAMHKGGRRA